MNGALWRTFSADASNYTTLSFHFVSFRVHNSAYVKELGIKYWGISEEIKNEKD